MAPDLVAHACRRCSATVRPGAPWCTQCYLAVRSPAPAEPSIHAPRPPSGPVGDRRWPCTACGTPNPLASDTCATCGLGFLADLRATEAPLLVLPGVGDLARLGRGQRIGAACAIVFAVVLLAGLVAFLLS